MQKLAELMRLACPRLNKAAFVIGMLSCLGMCVVATFQVSVHTCWRWNSPSLKNTSNAVAYSHFFCAFQETAVANVHRAGALLFFISGVVYMILQCIISCYTSPFGASVTLCRVRVGITVIASLAFLPSILSFYPDTSEGKRNCLSLIACPSSFLFTLLN